VDTGDRAYCAEGKIFVTGRVKDIHHQKAVATSTPHEVEKNSPDRVDGIRRLYRRVLALKDAGQRAPKNNRGRESRGKRFRLAVPRFAARRHQRSSQGSGQFRPTRRADSARQHSQNLQRKNCAVKKTAWASLLRYAHLEEGFPLWLQIARPRHIGHAQEYIAG